MRWYAELIETGGRTHTVQLTGRGYNLARDDYELSVVFPRSGAEDELSHTEVSTDVLGELITTCEQLLRDRGWSAALDELALGDARHVAGYWSDAVSEYYRAIESGLRYRIHEAGEQVAEGAALKKLASRAAELDLIAVNYAALFGFADSIRSPRKHGAALRADAVEIGVAESLLMGNHARTLLVYLGQRPWQRR